MTLGRPLVLVVEDDEDLREGVVTGLRRHGYAVIEAANGREAMGVLRNVVPDAMVVDLMMPVMDGRSFLEAKRAMADVATVPVVVATASGVFADVVDADLADTVIEKPFGVNKLMTAIARVVARRWRP